MSDVSNSADILDSRDIESRIDDIETEYTNDDGEFSPDMITDEDERREYDALIAFRNEMRDYVSDWRHGEMLIRDDYFETYAEELAGDVYGFDYKTGWPYVHINWEEAAESLKDDYHSGEFDGVTYWGRA